MDGFPLRSMSGRGHGSYPRFERHANASQVSQGAHERLINAQDNAPLSSEQPCGLSADCGTSTPFIPITEEARRNTSLPELNFRPTALKTWYLSILMLWQFLCMGGVIALMVLGEVQPPWFRDLQAQSIHQVASLVPLWDPLQLLDVALHAWIGRLSHYCILEGGNLNPEQIISLFASGDYLSAVVNLTILGTWFLTPLKSSLFQLVEDGRGWQIHVSKLFGFVGLAIYFWLLSTTFSIFYHLRSRQTGLKWNPAPLASQLCLLQGSNVFDSFEGIDYSDLRPLKNANMYLFDWYIIFATTMGLVLSAVAAYAWAKGLIFRPFRLTSMLSGTLQRAIVFSLLPALAYGLFHQTFLSSDVYMRTMMPIQNMASPLSDEDRHRIFGPEHEILKGATAANSMLLDYLSPSVLGCIAQAIDLGHYKIILGVVLATLSNSVYLVVARIFDFSEA
ncbi:hypothetical protein NCS52_01310600 [Fusarium sp. LHS14.1]|nr:hypothetical protein NCS52_01310600 [Fusarium sp. LHS14.1]